MIFGIQALITPLAPPRYVPLGLDDDLAITFLRHWNEVTPATRVEVLDLFERARGNEFLPRADSLDPVTLAAVAQTCDGFDVLIDIIIECTYTTAHFEIRYSVLGLFPVPPEGAEDDGVPDYVENVGENLESSWTVYRGLEYDYPDEKLPIKVQMGLDPLLAGGGLVLPDQTIRLSNVDGDTYLPRHELFHVFQYEFGPDSEEARISWLFHVKSPKTSASRRAVELDSGTVQALKEWRARQLQERLRAGEAWQDGDWVVTDELGAPFILIG